MKNKIKNYILSLEFILSLDGLLCGSMQGIFNIPLLSFVSFTPLMYGLLYAKSRERFALNFFSFFMPYYFVQLTFLVTVYDLVPMKKLPAFVIMLLCVLFLVIWESLLMFLPVYLIRWLKRNCFTDVLVLSFFICAGEWLQEHIFFLSFPWSAVWLTVTDMPILFQTANIFGARAVTFIVLCMNGYAVLAVTEKNNSVKTLSLASMVIIQSANLWYGYYSLKECRELSDEGEKVNVVCAQDNAEGIEKENLTPLETALSYREILKSVTTADIILMPETSVPDDYDEKSEAFRLIAETAKEKKSTIVFGCFYKDGNEYNAMYALTQNGILSQPYCKQILVPFGEKIPLAFLFDESTLSECKDRKLTMPIKTEENIIASAICIESVYSDILRKQTASSAQLICVSTNDSWFGKSFARQQHFRHSIMRATENRKWLMRAGNCGISALISPCGKVTAQKKDSSKGLVTGEVSLIDHRSFYAQNGELIITVPVFLAVVAILRRFKK